MSRKTWPKNKPVPTFQDLVAEAKFWDEWRIDPGDGPWEEVTPVEPLRLVFDREVSGMDSLDVLKKLVFSIEQKLLGNRVFKLRSGNYRVTIEHLERS